MKLLSLRIFLLLFSLAFAACSKSNDVIGVSNGDSEMNAAIEKARSTLPQFWTTFEKREHGESDFSLKVRIQDGEKVEHFWTIKLERDDGKVTGQINNDPEYVSNVRLGQKIAIQDEQISDWLYVRDGKVVGNWTVRPLFKKMSPQEVAKMKSMMADPE